MLLFFCRKHRTKLSFKFKKHIFSFGSIVLVVALVVDTLKKHCLSKIVAPLVKDLQKFQTENISIDNQTCLMGNNNYIFGSIATISAGNVGAHYLGGFPRCFSSGRICRFCMCTYNDLINKCTEAEFML